MRIKRKILPKFFLYNKAYYFEVCRNCFAASRMIAIEGDRINRIHTNCICYCVAHDPIYIEVIPIGKDVSKVYIHYIYVRKRRPCRFDYRVYDFTIYGIVKIISLADAYKVLNAVLSQDKKGRVKKLFKYFDKSKFMETFNHIKDDEAVIKTLLELLKNHFKNFYVELVAEVI